VEQLLDVRRVDPNILLKIGQGILKASSRPVEDVSNDADSFSKSLKLARQISPTPQLDHWESAKSILGIKFGLYGLSFSHVELSSGKLLSWKVVPFDKGSIDHEKVYQKANVRKKKVKKLAL